MTAKIQMEKLIYERFIKVELRIASLMQQRDNGFTPSIETQKIIVLYFTFKQKH